MNVRARLSFAVPFRRVVHDAPIVVVVSWFLSIELRRLHLSLLP